MSLEDYKDLISTSATITTIIQQLSGITVCKKYAANGSTGESSSVSFVSILYYFLNLQLNVISYYASSKVTFIQNTFYFLGNRSFKCFMLGEIWSYD